MTLQEQLDHDRSLGREPYVTSLAKFLPTWAVYQGYRLLAVCEIHDDAKYLTILVDSGGSVAERWERTPSMATVFETLERLRRQTCRC